jgi:hypothetical protein
MARALCLSTGNSGVSRARRDACCSSAGSLGKHGRDQCAPAWFGVEREFAAARFDPMAHSRQAMAGCAWCRRVKAFAVVVHSHQDVGPAVEQHDARVAGLGILACVVQGFLHHPVDGELRRVVDVRLF